MTSTLRMSACVCCASISSTAALTSAMSEAARARADSAAAVSMPWLRAWRRWSETITAMESSESPRSSMRSSRRVKASLNWLWRRATSSCNALRRPAT
ncbi:MAG TPA: hypothetical protein VG148_03210 [Pyrinomonadaceae bacterium]|nr:hypothetical protein [Pyrinomonadaceae bacterium]